MEIACGRCLGCRLTKAREWSVRCMHEAAVHEHNSFITLTYDNDHLPSDHQLNHKHWQQFAKNLRKYTKFRYFMCGEYGDENLRPHYHAIIFGYDFPDKTYWRQNRANKLFRSEQLERLWPHGNSEIGNVTSQSAGYVARYNLKKANQDQRTSEEILDTSTGELKQLKPSYTAMSLKPGIGHDWLIKHWSDVFPEDRVITPEGKTIETPLYYRALLKKENPELYEELRALRVEKAKLNPDNTPERLKTREICKEQQTKTLKREL